MASSKIRGITIEIGGETTKLGKALESVEKTSKDLQSELKGVNTLLKLDPKNVELLNQKQELLTKSIAATEDKLGTLKSTMDKIKSGEIEVTEEQFRDLQREIVLTEQKLDSLKKESKNFGSVAKQEFKETADEFEKIGSKAGEIGKNLGLGLGAMATGAIASVEATREFRQDLGKLETTFETTNHGAETATGTFKTLYGILGEDDTAIEAANHLAQMTDNEKELEQWTDILTGVYATFGDSLPLEGLAEAANETAKVGKVTGPLADAINWLGISEDEFNKKLEATNSEQERNALIRDTLNGLYGEASSTYKEVNKDVIDNNEAQAEMNLKLAEINNKLQPLITNMKIFLAEVLEKLTPIITWIIDNFSILAPIVLGFLGTLFALNIASKIMALIPIIKSLNATMAANPIGLVITAIGLLITIFTTLWINCESFRNFWIDLWNKIVEVLEPVIEWMKEAFKTAWEYIKQVWDSVKPYFEIIWNNIKTIFSVVVDVLGGYFKMAWNAIKVVWDLVTGYFKMVWNNIKTIFSVVKSVLSGDFKGAWDGIKQIWDNVKGYFKQVWEGIKSIFSGVTDWFKNTFSKAWKAVKDVFSSGGKIFDGIKDGIASTFKTVVNGLIGGINKVIAVPFNAINSTLNKIRSVSIAGVEPFKNFIKYNALSVPQIPKLKVGTNYIPEDDFPALLHKGEQVIPAKYNPAINDGYMKNAMFDALTDFTNVRSQGSSEISTLATLLNKYMPQIIDNMGRGIYLDKKVLVGELTPSIDTELGSLANRRRRGV